ncbi:hypothetical protein EVG20_g5673 [Dentipellis fragilis]|uniref:Uncharacterized protein n=1 Tax=Dentipellis fragilis TaxID=205917 RepID=A0A4Y9YS41_9AGAM|nr:hypothetical protein EVG20_g5673 [Dentipellis fragilis]
MGRPGSKHPSSFHLPATHPLRTPSYTQSPFYDAPPPSTRPSVSISKFPLYNGYSEVRDRPRIAVDEPAGVPITDPEIGDSVINANDTPFGHINEKHLRVYFTWPGYGSQTLYIVLSGRQHKLTCGNFVSEVAAQICTTLDKFAGETQFPYEGLFAKLRLHCKARSGLQNEDVYLRALKPIINDEG